MPVYVCTALEGRLSPTQKQAIAREALRLALIHHKSLATGLKGVQQERTISDIFEQSASSGSLNPIGESPGMRYMRSSRRNQGPVVHSEPARSGSSSPRACSGST